jgi:hypothetical protein
VKRLTVLTVDKEGAQRVVDALLSLGVASDDVSLLVVSRAGDVVAGQVKHQTGVPKGTLVGTALGGIAGVGLVAIGWLPGVFALGPAVAALQGLAGGAAAGTLVGALAGLGWWKIEADVPAELRDTDGVLVGVPISEERAEQAAQVAREAGAKRVYVT